MHSKGTQAESASLSAGAVDIRHTRACTAVGRAGGGGGGGGGGDHRPQLGGRRMWAMEPMWGLAWAASLALG